ncbi:MAG: hypothetical protein ACOYMA_10275 [Bacteroidia bacterium]
MKTKILFFTLFTLQMAFARAQYINLSGMKVYTQLADDSDGEGEYVSTRMLYNYNSPNDSIYDEITYSYYKDGRLKSTEFKHVYLHATINYYIYDENLNKIVEYNVNILDSTVNAKYYKNDNLVEEYNFNCKQFSKIFSYMSVTEVWRIWDYIKGVHPNEKYDQYGIEIFNHEAIFYDSIGAIISKHVLNEDYFEYSGDSILLYFERGPIHFIKYPRMDLRFFYPDDWKEILYSLVMKAYNVNGIEMKYFYKNGALEKHIVQDTIIKLESAFDNKYYNVIYLKEKRYDKKGKLIQILRYPLNFCVDIMLERVNQIEGTDGFSPIKSTDKLVDSENGPDYDYISVSQIQADFMKKQLEVLKKYSYSKILIKGN